MKKNVMVAAVAAAFVAPAFAQSSVTVGGTVNIMWDNVRAAGNTGGDTAAGLATQNGLKSADRVRDGAGSNIRFTVIEDLGGGNSAFVQVESAVIQNSDTRADLVGNNSGIGTNGGNTAIWGNRNTGIGIRSKTAGRFLIGVWDVHYHEHYNIDPAWIIGNSAWSTLNLQQNMGTGITGHAQGFGGRLGNVIRWDSPVWGGFSMSLTYARPTDGVVPNATGDIRDGKKNRNWSFAPRYEAGGLTVQYSYMQDKDGISTYTNTIGGAGLNFNGVAQATAAVTSVWKIKSNRLGVRYKFANGLGIGGIWDQGKTDSQTTAGTNQFNLKRTVWSFPISYEAGNHQVMATWARARDWRGSINGVNVNNISITALGSQANNTLNFGSNTGAKQISIGYMYKLSQRTNVHVGYSKTTNEALVRYDMFANASGNTAIGADPRSVSFGLRHTF